MYVDFKTIPVETRRYIILRLKLTGRDRFTYDAEYQRLMNVYRQEIGDSMILSGEKIEYNDLPEVLKNKVGVVVHGFNLLTNVTRNGILMGMNEKYFILQFINLATGEKYTEAFDLSTGLRNGEKGVFGLMVKSEDLQKINAFKKYCLRSK